ncbi:Glycine betaine transporter BetP [Corynebacterium guangdongense]|uniref:Choline/carnitine/betaine transport n=1 Tax=Corynebacterium guangdongense TaxID=1783348 RepID=A0ABU1ZYJ8_9CORY|nr:choline/carnitine/betaine transport [Corynebacterium guangdongense]WJZ18572.1 Glycine betaine transporter BetP [Corynebacterium guangdongense]
MSTPQNPRPVDPRYAEWDGATAPAPGYPDDLHPGLVPGIGVDQQRNRFAVDKTLFTVTAVFIVAFIAWGLISPAGVSAVSAAAFAWAMENLGWLLNIVMILSFGVMVYLAFSRFGRIKLGRDDEEPEFSRFSWVAMMFAAGIGVGIFFFGPSEPLTYFLSPPPETVAPGTPAALHQAMAQSHFHWGLPAWSLYALVGGAMAYSVYRRGRVLLISSIFAPWLGTKATDTWVGRLIDMLAIFATLFGTAATLGLAATQISEGVQLVGGLDGVGNTMLIVIMAVLSLGFIVSAVSGVSKGIRVLSNLNMSLTGLAIFFVFLFGPTLFLLNLLPSGVLVYFHEFLPMLSKSLSWGSESIAFQSAWTAFYWAWWVSWAPFVGMFIARISRGRTLREFLLVCMLVPTSILILAFTVFGGTAITFAMDGRPGFDGESSFEAVLFAMFEQLPLNSVTPVIIIFILAVFFITSADSASTVMGTMSSRGNPNPNKAVIVFWGLCMVGIAVVMLLAGGEETLSALQALTILIAMPFALVMIAMMIVFLRDLATDPAAIRRSYAKTAVENAVVRGLEEHGDDFELAVKYAPGERGAGADFDSMSEEVTEWYRRTDEDGNEVAYDYETDTWADGWTEDTAGEPGPDTDPGTESGRER